MQISPAIVVDKKVIYKITVSSKLQLVIFVVKLVTLSQPVILRSHSVILVHLQLTSLTPSTPRSSESFVHRPSTRSSSSHSSDVKRIVEEPDQQEEYTLFTLPSSTCAPLYATVTVDNKPLII